MVLAQQKEDLNLKASAVSQANVSVRNFGPIAKADINLKPLTIFVGPSNTGKSYLAILLYALQQFFAPNSYSMFGKVHRIIGHNKLIKKLQAERNLKRSKIIGDSYKNYLENIKDKHELRQLMVRYFNVDDLIELKRAGSKRHAVVKVGFNTYNNKEFHTEFTFNLGSKVNIRSTSSSILLESFGLEKDRENLDHAAKIANQLSHLGEDNFITLDHMFLYKRLLDKIIFPFNRNTYYLPASRTGIMNSQNIIMSSLIRTATYDGLRFSGGSREMLSGIIADFLDNLIIIATNKRPPIYKNLREYAEIIEDSILQGKVIADSKNNYPTFSYKANNWDNKQINIVNSSSMISELAPLILHLQNLVIIGDTLIIEEPEAHLHPAAQAKLAEHIAKLIEVGLRVVITTHSEWLMEKFANLIQKDESGIKQSDLGVWLFSQSNKLGGTQVKEIKLQEDSDTYPDGFEEVSIALYNEWAKLQKKNS